MANMNGITRRGFLKGMAATGAVVSLATVLPTAALAKNDKSNNKNNNKNDVPGKDGIFVEGSNVNLNGQAYTLEFIQPVKLVAISNKVVDTEGVWRSSNKHLVSVDPDGTVVMRDGVGGHEVEISWTKGTTTYSVLFITGQMAEGTIEVDRPQTRGDFMIQLAEYFGWFHYHGWMDDGSDIDDNANLVDVERVRNYYDVVGKADYVKPIECALDQGVLVAQSSSECFYPESAMTREDAAVILCSAFKIDPIDDDFLAAFDDVKNVAPGAYAALNVLFAKGYMWGRTSTTIDPTAGITPTETRIIIENITRRRVAPVWATPTSNRKFARVRAELFCPTEGATIKWTAKAFNWSDDKMIGQKIQDLTIGADFFAEKDYIHGYTTDPFFGMQGFTKWPYETLYHGVIMKARAVKEGMEDGPTTTFIYRIQREPLHNFATDCLHKGSKDYPMVYRYFDYFQAAAYYIEGSEMGIIYDGLQPTNTAISLVDRVKEVATPGKKIIFVLGHNHPDHKGALPAAAAAGMEIYTLKRVNGYNVGSTVTQNRKDNDGGDLGALKTLLTEDNLHLVEEGYEFDLGNCKFKAYHLPGHTDDMLMIHDAEHGLLFSSDIYGVNRYWVADQFTAAGVRQDLLMSIHQQLMDCYHENGGVVKELYTGHNRTGCGEEYLAVWEQALQQQVDFGPDYISQDRRANGSTLSISGHPYKSMNWIGFVAAEKQQVVEYVGEVDKKPFRRIETVAKYTPNLYYGDPMTVAALSNLKIQDAKLVGHDFNYKAGQTSANTKLADGTLKYIIPNKFFPIDTEYEVIIGKKQKEVTFVPTTMSTRATMTVNGKPAATRCPVKVSTAAPAVITVTAPDGETTMTYTLTFITK